MKPNSFSHALIFFIFALSVSSARKARLLLLIGDSIDRYILEEFCLSSESVKTVWGENVLKYQNVHVLALPAYLWQRCTWAIL